MQQHYRTLLDVIWIYYPNYKFIVFIFPIIFNYIIKILFPFVNEVMSEIKQSEFYYTEKMVYILNKKRNKWQRFILFYVYTVSRNLYKK